MSQGGYFLIIRDFKRQVRFEERIENERYFTDTVTLDMWHGSSREIALISLDGSSIGTICLVERRQKVATYKTLLRFSNFFNLEVPVPFEAIQAHMDNRVRRYFEQLAASSEGGWITPATWDDVIRVISDLRPETNSALEQLGTLRDGFRGDYDSVVDNLLAEEKDAYASILRFADFDRSAGRTVTSWSFQEEQSDAVPTSFIAALNAPETITITEDQAIEFDATRFGDWNQLRQFVTGERIFQKGEETLLIRNVNRQSLEKTLGVDLIYYNYNYRSFVLVQYKRMLREKSEYRYRPDNQFKEEIQRMQDFETETAALVRPPTALAEYRLNNGAFYFKFHDDEIFDPVNASLIQGMHVSLAYWELFEKSAQARGPHGGVFVGYNNVGRYLNNTEFEMVVGKGLVGSSGMITNILLEIVKPLVLDLKHSVTVGIKV